MRETVRVTRRRWDLFFAPVTLLFVGLAWTLRKDVGLLRALSFPIPPLILWAILRWSCPPAGFDAPKLLSGPPAERRFWKLWLLLFPITVGGGLTAALLRIPWFWVAPAAALLLGVVFHFARQVDRERAATARSAGPTPSR